MIPRLIIGLIIWGIYMLYVLILPTGLLGLFIHLTPVTGWTYILSSLGLLGLICTMTMRMFR